ncbi:LysE family transporter [Devosia oryziradicis]|uniref:LysE family transporter n=1 Tax=Devosia oryziradicis TaxID=2801335 RepID=A0ABX7C664_9HYPH|nr:LysE family transporter [Devosia oryziradicis]QQR37466.1 LysE family transporter [Devosia oryziradicis]
MTDLVPFILAVLALLATPGPTNTLMAAAGAQRGLARSLPLLAGELGGYAIAITVWIELVGRAAAAQPLVPVIAKFIAAAFLTWSAWKLWVNAGHADLERRGITLGRVFATTMINPKALVFAFAIFPQVGFVARLPYLGLFVGMVVATAIGWMILGAVAARSSAGLFTGPRVERITAVALAVFATLLAVQTVPGMVVG